MGSVFEQPQVAGQQQKVFELAELRATCRRRTKSASLDRPHPSDIGNGSVAA